MACVESECSSECISRAAPTLSAYYAFTADHASTVHDTQDSRASFYSIKPVELRIHTQGYLVGRSLAGQASPTPRLDRNIKNPRHITTESTEN